MVGEFVGERQSQMFVQLRNGMTAAVADAMRMSAILAITLGIAGCSKTNNDEVRSDGARIHILIPGGAGGG